MVAGGNKPERQGPKAGHVFVADGLETILRDPRQYGLKLRQIVGTDEAEAFKKFVIRRQPLENVDHDFGQPQAFFEKIAAEANRLQNTKHVGVFTQPVDGEFVAHRRTEQYVFRHGSIGIEFFRIEAFDELRDLGVLQPPAHLLSGFQNRGGKLRLLLRVDGPAQPYLIDIGREAGHPQDLVYPRRQIVGAADGRHIDPIGQPVIFEVAGTLRLSNFPLALLGVLAFHRPLGLGPVLQTVEQVVPDGSREHVGVLTHIRNLPANDGLRKLDEIMVADTKPAAVRREQSGKHLRQFVLAAAAGPDQRHMPGKIDRQGGAVDNPQSVILGKADVRGDQLAGKLGRTFGLFRLGLLFEHSRRLKLVGDLRELDPGVFHALVVGQQHFPRRRHILIGGEHGDQRPQREIAPDHQPAADRIEEERRQQGEGVVDELDQELEDVNPEPDPVDDPETAGKVGQFELRGIVGVNFRRPADRFADPLREFPNRLHPLFPEGVDLPLEYGD